MRLLPLSAAIHDSQIAFLGRNLVKLPEKDMCDIRGSEISMIFQEPGTSLNPVYQVGAQVIEAIMLHQKVSKEEAVERTIELFREVGIPEPERRIFSYPHENIILVSRSSRASISRAQSFDWFVFVLKWQIVEEII